MSFNFVAESVSVSTKVHASTTASQVEAGKSNLHGTVVPTGTTSTDLLVHSSSSSPTRTPTPPRQIHTNKHHLHLNRSNSPQGTPDSSNSCNSMSPDSVTHHPDNHAMNMTTVAAAAAAHKSASEKRCMKSLSREELTLELPDAQDLLGGSSSPNKMQIPLRTKTSDESSSMHSGSRGSVSGSNSDYSHAQENISPNSCMNGLLSRSAESIGKSFGKSILGMQAPVPAIQIPDNGDAYGYNHADGDHSEEPRGENFCLTPPTPPDETSACDSDNHAHGRRRDEDRNDASTSPTRTRTNSPPIMPELSDEKKDNIDGSGESVGDGEQSIHTFQSQTSQHTPSHSLTPRQSRGRCFAEDADEDHSILSQIPHNPNKDTITTEHTKSYQAGRTRSGTGASKSSSTKGKGKRSGSVSVSVSGSQLHTSDHNNDTSSHSSNNNSDEEPNLAGESFIDVGEAMPMQETQGYTDEHGESEEYVNMNMEMEMDMDVNMAHMDESYEWSRMACECEMAGDYSSALHYYEMCWDAVCYTSPYDADYYDNEEDNQIRVRDHCRRMASMLKSIGTLQWKSGTYQRSLKVLTMSRTTIVEAISFSGQFDRETLEMKEELCEILNAIGRVYLSLGKPDESLQYHKKSLSILTSLYTGQSNDDSDRWDVDAMAVDNEDLYGDHGYESDPERNQSQRSMMSQQRNSKSDLLMTRAKTIAHPAVARTIILMGIVQSMNAQYSVAMTNFKEGLILQRKVLGSSHVDIAATMNAIGALYEETGQLEKAMQCYKKARKIYTQQLGENHVDYAVTMNYIGQIYHQIGKQKKAMQFYREALRITKQVLGRSHRNIASILYNMGLVHLQCCQFDKASKMFKDTLRVQREALGDFHIDVALTLEVLGGIYERRRKIEKALQLYHKALRIRQTVSSNDICVAIALDRIGKCRLNFTVDVR